MTPLSAQDLPSLNAAFAEKVAGWKFVAPFDWYPPEHDPYCDPLEECPRFTESVDLVLPYLAKKNWNAANGWASQEIPSGIRVSVWTSPMAANGEDVAIGTTFPHAAVIALLRSVGVAVGE